MTSKSDAGRKGGQASTEAKAKASARNGVYQRCAWAPCRRGRIAGSCYCAAHAKAELLRALSQSSERGGADVLDEVIRLYEEGDLGVPSLEQLESVVIRYLAAVDQYENACRQLEAGSN